MSLIVVIVAVIVILLFLIVFSFGYFMGLGRKKKDMAILEQEREIQIQKHESIINRLLDDKGEEIVKKEESGILPVKMINKGYKRIKKIIKLKSVITDLKEIDVVKYIRKYLLSYIGIGVLIFGFGYFIKFAIAAEYVPIVGRFMISVLVAVLFVENAVTGLQGQMTASGHCIVRVDDQIDQSVFKIHLN